MKLTFYHDTESFGADVLDILMENEVMNNLPIRFITHGRELYNEKWLLAAVRDAQGMVVLTAACTPPYNIVLYETGGVPNEPAIRLLADELRRTGVHLPGVLAERGTALRFAEAYAGSGGYRRHMAMNIMRLDCVQDVKKAPGVCRTLQESDLFFAPYWVRAFSEECRTEIYGIAENITRLRGRIERGAHYVWEDEIPVSQAVHGLSTINGAVISEVYTPPQYRGRGYAASIVAELSARLLARGYKFCCLFADADNPVSHGIYAKIGYRDVCLFDELRF